MRTTVTLDQDVASEVERLRREQGVGVSAALNALARKGLARGPQRERFEQRTSRMEARIDVANVADALETLEGSSAR